MAEVSILMCTYNGERYLKEQLESFRKQTVVDWDLLVSDDGSTDGTINLIKRFSEDVSNHVSIVEGPKINFASNFLHASKCSPEDSLFYAFSDQDDIWNPNKLEDALIWLRAQDPSVPALYCSRTEYVNQEGNSLIPKRFSRVLRADPSFANALVQSSAGGNTMVFNHAARDLLLGWGTDLNIPSHDWWLYILVLGVGGIVKFDPKPSLKYRQHSSNLIGGNLGIQALFIRGIKFLRGIYREQNSLNIMNLLLRKEQLTNENLNTLELFSKARSGMILSRYISLYKSGVYRQGITGVFLWLGPLINRI